jgi:sugar phosphate isomerase/epimerase
VDFFAEAGFDGVDVSLENITLLEDAWQSVLYSMGNRAASKGLCMPVCHLPFFMPDPDDESAMKRFTATVRQGIEAADLLKIRRAVIHPIVRHSSKKTYAQFMQQNVDYLTPLCDMAAARGIALLLENMPGKPYKNVNDDIAYGSRAEDIAHLCDTVKIGACWDFGHAHLTGLRQSEALAVMGARIAWAHVHDNDGFRDSHLIPYAGGIDWEDAMKGLQTIRFLDRSGNWLDLELKGSGLAADRCIRLDHAARAISAARVLVSHL